MTLKVDAHLLLQMQMVKLRQKSKYPFPVLSSRVEVRWNSEEACNFMRENGYKDIIDSLQEEISRLEEIEGDGGEGPPGGEDEEMA